MFTILALITLPAKTEYVDITFKPIKGNLERGNFHRYVALIKPRFHRSSGAFFSTLAFTCLYLSLPIYRFILRLCGRKFERVAVVNVIVTNKRELSQWPNLCLQMFVRAWKFSPKNLRTEEIPRVSITR